MTTSEHITPDVLAEAEAEDRWREQERQYKAWRQAGLEAEARLLQNMREEREAKEAALERRAAEDARALAEAPATAWRLVDQGSAEIAKADAKAGFAVTIELAALLAVSEGKGGVDGPLQWVAGGFLVVAVIAAVLVVLPRLPARAPGSHWLHFGALRQLPAGDLASRIQVGHLEEICHQATVLSRIAYSKHLRLRWSLLIALAGGVAAALATF